MNSALIKKKYLEKIKLLKKYNKFYYEKNDPKISDQKYDKLKLEILKLEIENKKLSSEDSPSKTVGYKPSKNFVKATHKIPMLSLGNAFNEEDLKNFEKKIFNYLNENIKFEYSVEPKIDGISASLTYKNGELYAGVSRGDGNIGELITSSLSIRLSASVMKHSTVRTSLS